MPASPKITPEASPEIKHVIKTLGLRLRQPLSKKVVEAVTRRPERLMGQDEMTTLEIEEYICKAHAQAGIYLRQFRAAHPECWGKRKPEHKCGEHTWPAYYKTQCFKKWWKGHERRRRQMVDVRDELRHAEKELDAKLKRRIEAAKDRLREAGEALTPDAILDRAREIRYAWLTREGCIVDSLLLPQGRSSAGDVEMLTLTDAVCRRQWDDPEIARPWIALWQRLWRSVEKEPALRAAERQQDRFAVETPARRRRKPA